MTKILPIKTWTILCLTILTIGCNKTQNDPIEPEPKGHFKITFGKTTKTFFDENSKGEECEKEVKKVMLFVYEHGSDAYLYQKEFVESEVQKKAAIISIPSISSSKSYDFYAVANYTFVVGQDGLAPDADPTQLTRTQLLAITQSDIAAYNGGAFTDIFPTEIAVSKRADGFVMSGSTFDVPPAYKTPDDPTSGLADAPRQVTINIDRLAAKIAVRAYTTDTFQANYGNVYGSKVKVTSVELISEIAAPAVTSQWQCALIKPTTEYTTPASGIEKNSITFAQTPKSHTLATLATVPGVTATDQGVNVFDNIFYTFENGIATRTLFSKHTLKIYADFDFDGNEATTNDITKLYYITEAPAFSGSSWLARNNYYRINAQINGLTPLEVKATIIVSDWASVSTQDIPFGN